MYEEQTLLSDETYIKQIYLSYTKTLNSFDQGNIYSRSRATPATRIHG